MTSLLTPLPIEHFIFIIKKATTRYERSALAIRRYYCAKKNDKDSKKKMCMIVKDKAKFRNLNGIRTINP